MKSIRDLAGVCTLAVLLAPEIAGAIELDDPINFQVIQTWTGTTVGVPGRLGAMLFSQDGQTLYVVGDSETSTSALYALEVLRDGTTNRVTGFGAANRVFYGDPSIPGLDSGLEVGPDGTLFYTYWDAHYIGQRVATSTVETVFPMDMTGVPSSVAGLTFSPHLTDPSTAFGQLQVSSWLGNGIYNVPLTPLGGGLFQPGMATLFVALPQQGTGAIKYVPQGLFTGNLMYVNWDFGEVRMLVVDRETGLPIDDMTGLPTLGTTTPRDIRFAYDIGRGPWGLEFDPLTLDFFVSTWAGTPSNAIVQFSGPGFANQAPVAQDQTLTTSMDTPLMITLTATDADMNPLTFSVVSMPMNGALTGTTATVVYTPNAGFAGMDAFAFSAFDGQLESNTATITIAVLAGPPIDAGVVDASVGDTGSVSADAGSADAGFEADATGPADATGADATGPADAMSSSDALGANDATQVADAMPGTDGGVANNARDAGAADESDDECSCATTRRSDSNFSLFALLALVVIGRRKNGRR